MGEVILKTLNEITDKVGEINKNKISFGFVYSINRLFEQIKSCINVVFNPDFMHTDFMHTFFMFNGKTQSSFLQWIFDSYSELIQKHNSSYIPNNSTYKQILLELEIEFPLVVTHINSIIELMNTKDEKNTERENKTDFGKKLNKYKHFKINNIKYNKSKIKYNKSKRKYTD